MNPTGFVSRNTDKILVLAVLFLFYFGSWWGFYRENPNFANASLDLTKQLAAAFLTLTVSSRIPWSNQSPRDGNNGSSSTSSTTTNGTTQGGTK